MKCCICTKEIEKQKSPDGHVYWDKGHNPVPFKDAGRCCTDCNAIHVIPARLDAFLQGRSTDLPSKT
jgi:hypothetical protein